MDYCHLKCDTVQFGTGLSEKLAKNITHLFLNYVTLLNIYFFFYCVVKQKSLFKNSHKVAA